MRTGLQAGSCLEDKARLCFLSMRARHLAALVLFALTACMQACTGESFETGAGGAGGEAVEPNCEEDLFSCGPGLTCWLGTDGGDFIFDCFNEGGVPEGEPCLVTVGAPTCRKDFFCNASPGQESGTCVRYCDQQDPERACPGGLTCQPVNINMFPVTICI